LTFVAQAYRDLLHREPDSSGLVAFSSALANGSATHDVIALAILGSPEYQNNQIQSLFSTYLHRVVEPAGLNAFRTLLASGGTSEQVAAIIAGSAEYFQNRGGGSNDGFLQALYQDALNRPIDAGGRAVFRQALAAGATPAQIASTILASPEYRQQLVQSFYQQFLHRAADPGGLSVFVSALQSGDRDERVIAALIGSDEYLPGASSANSNPLTLTADEVDKLLQRAAAASASRDAIIAILDRGGHLLGVRVEDGVSSVITGNTANLVFAIDGAMALARTAAFFANNSGDGTPLTSRTIRDISQTTMTQREIMSNPNNPDPNSTLRGPGFVAPIGIGGHFPPNVPFTPQVDLFAIEHTNRDSLGSPNRFNVPDAFIPSSIPADQRLAPPASYGVITGIIATAQGRGIATLPGGIPIFKREPNGSHSLVGGIGVFFPGTTGFATEENSSMDATYNPTKRDRSLEAEFMAFAAVGGIPGVAPIGTLDGVDPVKGIYLPGGRLDLVGITLDVFGPTGSQGLPALLAFGRTLGMGSHNDGTDMPIDMSMNPVHTLRDGSLVPEGWLVTPHDGNGLTAVDVVRIVSQGIQQANRTRAAIRLPLESRTRMVFAVSDRDGNVLGLYRMPDSTVFSIDVAVAKSRNVAYYADPTKLQPSDQTPGVPPGVAFSNRTFRFEALPRFPEGIERAPPGPFSILNDGGVDPRTGLQVGPPLPASAFQSVQGFDAFNPGTNFHDPTNPANHNGIVFFPGAVPLYKDINKNGQPVLVGGFGVSGDGVDQDDVVTAAGAQGYTHPANVLQADQVTVRGVRLPYQKFNRNPEG
jgi:uncharacterized protein GlcG (DUF336 family)